jgi:hypothetical protein
MRAWIVRLLIARPVPEHDGQGSTTRPRPRHFLHGSDAKLPRFLLYWPVPWQVGHTLGTVPGFAPVPWQVLHAFSWVNWISMVAPSLASVGESVASVSRSAPRLAFGVLDRGPNKPPNRSPSLACC